METSSQATASPFVYSSEEIAFKAAKRLMALFEKRGHPSLSLGRAKQLIAACTGHSDWSALVKASIGPSRDTMDHDLDYGALSDRRLRQIEALAREGRIENDEARFIVCTCEPTGYGSGYLRWYLGADATSILLPDLSAGNEIEKIFPALETTLIDDILPLSLGWIVDQLSGLRIQVSPAGAYEVSVEIGSLSGEDTASIGFTYRRSMALWLNDDETYPLKPKDIYKLHIDYRVRTVTVSGMQRHRPELRRAAAQFILLDIWLNAYVVSERHQLVLPDVNLEIDIDESDAELRQLTKHMEEAFSDLVSIESVEDEITERVPFSLITIADIHVD